MKNNLPAKACFAALCRASIPRSLPYSCWSPAKNGHLHNFHPVMGEKQRLRFEASLGLLIRCLPGLLHLHLLHPCSFPSPAASLLWSSDAAFNYQPTTAQLQLEKAKVKGKNVGKRGGKSEGGRGKKQVRPASQDAARMCCQDIALYCAAS